MADTSFPQRRTPGVYITEINAFPPSIIGVQTAVPAFIGYTEKAPSSALIASMADYEAIFGGRFKGVYTIAPITKTEGTPPEADEFTSLDPVSGITEYYRLEPTSPVLFRLYDSLRLFFANGGGSAYIVSAGTYQGKSIDTESLTKGIDDAGRQVGPTMLVVPDAVSLPSIDDFQVVVQTMIMQCSSLEDRIAILDVYGTESVTDTENLNQVAMRFRGSVGDTGLSYGAAYFPFLQTTVAASGEFDYTNIALNDESTLTILKNLLSRDNTKANGHGNAYDRTQQAIEAIGPQNTLEEEATLSAALSSLSTLQTILGIIRDRTNLLPPSGAMAGVYTLVDTTRGVWQAPANICPVAVSGLSYNINGTDQAELNMPIDGKAINAIRKFPAQGVLVWGARTLDGNNNDYRYIQIRRTLIYIEQSIKSALNRFVFAANDSNTWTTVTSVISNFLQGLWAQGALMGATASEAFTVQCGLGSTMTSQDILNGYMIAQVTLQMIHPAEFIELTFKQTMEEVA